MLRTVVPSIWANFSIISRSKQQINQSKCAQLAIESIVIWVLF